MLNGGDPYDHPLDSKLLYTTTTFDMLVQFRMDRIFHHVLWDVAQIQLVLGLRRLVAQLWHENKFQAGATQAASISCDVDCQV